MFIVYNEFVTKILGRSFFKRSALQVAKELLGKFLVRKFGQKKVSVIITEVEAYVGPHDLASHASRGRTPRTEAMFGEAGKFYVYFTYGMHWMLNVVTGPEGYPAAVLIRGGTIIGESGEPRLRGRRAAVLMRGGKWQMARFAREARQANGEWTDIKGPARLTKFLKIDKRFNGKSANPSTSLRAGRQTGLWFEDRGIKIKPSRIKRGPRIGVDYAGEWAKKKYNFQI